MLSSRSFTAAIALALVAGCARQETPAAAPVAIVGVAPPPTTASAQVPSGRPAVEGPTPAMRHAADATSPGRVRPENLRALGSSAVPFASYLNAIHNKIHPEFTDKELAKLDALPPEHPLNQKTLATRVELVLEGSTGTIREVSVVKGSGSPQFDAIALEAVRRSGPFGVAPAETHSPDGNVYAHWDLRRDEVFACSTMHAYPFMLREPPRAAP